MKERFNQKVTLVPIYNQCSWIKNKTFFVIFSGQVQKTQTGWIGQALFVIPVNPNVVTSPSVAGHVDAANVAGHPPDVAVAVVRSRPAVRHVNDVFDTWNVVVAADVDVAQIRHDLVALPAAALAGRHLPVQPEQPQQDPPAFRNQHSPGCLDWLSRCKFCCPCQCYCRCWSFGPFTVNAMLLSFSLFMLMLLFKFFSYLLLMTFCCCCCWWFCCRCCLC
jgi:hypothetical protein